MRHGAALSAAESGTDGDAGRKLAPEGKEQAGLSAKRLKERGFLPGVIVSSPLRRAVETADIAAVFFPGARRIEEPALASPAPPADILRAVSRAAGADLSVMVVGHQPTLTALCVSILKTAGPFFSTGSFARLKLPDDMKTGRAELAEYFAPESF